jgi:hypothetical protein
MAQRRMFSPDVVESDAFLEMPASAQALYFHLGMYADDDGFVSPRKIMRLLGSTEDDMKLLVAKRFVLPFPNGVIVIKHWRLNNLVRKDWYRPTQYVDQKSQLFIKENGVYTDDSSQGTPLVNDSLTVRSRSIGKVSIDTTRVAIAPRVVEVTDSEESPPFKARKVTPEMKRVFEIFSDNPAHKVWGMREVEREAARVLHDTYGLEELAVRYEVSKRYRDEQMCPKIHSPSDMLHKMPKMEDFLKGL